ncbi:MAG: ThuA domain-containing protein [Kiritimatiellae bacterium]|jgi:type 1 glutamine amidotransferase|nr:ThuA domain-containing protein [Kiritimatiellia bacterium]
MQTPQTATNKYDKPGKIRVLIVDGFSNHNWLQTTLLTKNILEASGLFSVDVSSAPSTQESPGWDSWRPPFEKYDVIIQNCNSYGNRPTWPNEVQHNLETFIACGGGLYILHSGNNAFPNWKEYNRMIGLGWRDKDFGWTITIAQDGTIQRVPPGQGGNTSHGERFDAVLTRLDTHPIHDGLPKQWKVADLEVYSYARGPAENLTVLSYAREPMTGLQFPVEWVVNYGKGRVYNSTFGHVWQDDINPPSMRCVAFQTLLIRSIEWLSGNKVTWRIPSNFPDAQQIQLHKITTKKNINEQQ